MAGSPFNKTRSSLRVRAMGSNVLLSLPDHGVRQHPTARYTNSATCRPPHGGDVVLIVVTIKFSTSHQTMVSLVMRAADQSLRSRRPCRLNGCDQPLECLPDWCTIDIEVGDFHALILVPVRIEHSIAVYARLAQHEDSVSEA